MENALVSLWRRADLGRRLSLSYQAALAELQRSVQEKDSRKGEEYQAHEQAINAGDGAAKNNPRDSCEWDKAEQNRN